MGRFSFFQVAEPKVVPVAVVFPFRGQMATLIGCREHFLRLCRFGIIGAVQHALVLQFVRVVRFGSQVARFKNDGEREDVELETELLAGGGHLAQLSQVESRLVGFAVFKGFFRNEFNAVVVP